jgi:hypothetical protein
LVNDNLPASAMLHVQRQMLASKYPGKLVIICTPGGGGAGSSEAGYVIMRSGHPNLFPHELGHYLHLSHTYGAVPAIRDNMLDVFVRGQDKQLYQLSYSNLSSASGAQRSQWKNHADGSQMLSDPVVERLSHGSRGQPLKEDTQ